MKSEPYTVEISHQSAAEFLQEETVQRLSAAAQCVLKTEQVASAEISVAIVDSAEMQELNRRHLEHDYDTDVLSFLLEVAGGDESSSAADEPDALRGTGKTLEGEVIVCAQMAHKTAAKFGWSPADELVLYLVHGVLHLVGYDDLTESERKIMRSRERSILKQLDLTPHYSETCDEQEDPDHPPGAEPPPASTKKTPAADQPAPSTETSDSTFNASSSSAEVPRS